MCCDLAQASRCELEAGVSIPPTPLRVSITDHFSPNSRFRFAVRGASVRGRVTSVPLRKANGMAGLTCRPSLTSRGRLLTGGVEVLIRTSNDEGRVGRRHGIRMKSMTTGPYLSMPSLRVPASGGSKEAACLMELLMKIMRHEVMRTEVVADCYGGETCDQVTTAFRSHCDGDRDSDTHKDDIVIKLAELPAGALISVSYPCCPECGSPREDEFKHLSGGRMKIVGHKATCNCGFDWGKWIVGQYS